MNDIEIIFERSGLDIPHEYLVEIYCSEFKELLLEELAYFVCRDNLPKLMSKNIEKKNIDINKRIINNSEIYGYLLFKKLDTTKEEYDKLYKMNQITYIYHNPISNTDRFLSTYEIFLYKQIKKLLSKNISEKEAIKKVINIENHKLSLYNEKETYLKNKAHNAAVENILDDLTTKEKQLYFMLNNNKKQIVDVLKILNENQYSIRNIKELQPCIMQADIPSKNYLLNLQKTYEEHPNDIKYHLDELQHKENLSFENLSGLQIYQIIESYYKKQGLNDVSYMASSLLYSFNIKGTYNSLNESYVIFNPRNIENIQIVN